MNNFFSSEKNQKFILDVFKVVFRKKTFPSMCLISGVTLIASPWWLPIVYNFFNIQENPLSAFQILAGLFLIISGIFLFYKEKFTNNIENGTANNNTHAKQQYILRNENIKNQNNCISRVNDIFIGPRWLILLVSILILSSLIMFVFNLLSNLFLTDSNILYWIYIFLIIVFMIFSYATLIIFSICWYVIDIKVKIIVKNNCIEYSNGNIFLTKYKICCPKYNCNSESSLDYEVSDKYKGFFLKCDKFPLEETHQFRISADEFCKSSHD